MTTLTLDALKATQGQSFGPSRWFDVDQSRIDLFAEVTEARQFIHLDPERAAAESPFSGTVAHGFLVAALLSAMSYDALPTIAGQNASINYGFDRLRFLAPVTSGARLRGLFVLTRVSQRSEGEVLLGWAVTVEVEGQNKPALAADWLTLHVLGHRQ